MRILIIGGTRFIGKAVAHRATARGHRVTLFNRGKSSEGQDAPGDRLVGDVDRLAEHQEQLRALRPDVVIHCIAYTERHGTDLVQAFAGTGTRVVLLSSQDCYEAFYQLNAGRDVADLPLGEDAPTCARRHYWRERPGAKTYPDYDRNLLTDVVLAAHRAGRIQATVLRLPMVFGPGDFQFRHRHGKVIRRIHDRQETLVLGMAEQGSLFTYGYVGDVAAAIIHAAETPAADGRTFNIGELKSRSQRRWAELFAAAAAWPLTVVTVPDALSERDPAAANASPRLLQFDTSAFRAATGFIDTVPLAQQISATLAWGLAHPDALGDRPDYDAERRLVERYRTFLASQP